MKNQKLDQLLDYLAKNEAGVLANQIEVDLGFNERLVRALAAQSRGRVVSYNGGYKLTVKASLEEKLECTGRLRSQAAQMQDRAQAVDAVWHEEQLHRTNLSLPMELPSVSTAPEVVPNPL